MKKLVDECPVGPEMDAAVARALGHCSHDLEKTIHWSEDGCGEVCHECKHCHKKFWGLAYREGYHISPYSTDIAAAWEGADEISFRQDSTLGCFSVRCHGWIGECWIAGWIDQPAGDVIARAETAPHAICRAILKANGVEFVEMPL